MKSSSTSVSFIVQLMAVSAILSGLIQLAAVLVSQHALGMIVSMGPHMLWMMPVAMLLLFAFPALLLIVLSRRATGDRSRRLIVWVAAFLGFLNLTLSIPRVHPVASIVLACGLGVVAVRLLVPQWIWLNRAVRRAVIPLGAMVVLLAAGVFGIERFRERQALGKLPVIQAGAPNILLLVLDTVRSLNLSAYGYGRPTTPTMQALGERGVLFENAIATSSWTLPSHSSLFTGRFPFELTADWETPLSSEYRTLAEQLKSQGYLTGGFSANLAYVNRNYGLQQGFDRFEDYAVSWGEIISSSKLGRDLVNARWFRWMTGYHDFLGRKSAADLTDAFLGWVGAGKERPFFGFINFFDAHEPYLPPEPYDTRFVSSGTSRQNLNMLHLHHRAERLDKNQLTPAEVQREIDAYDGGIAYADAEIGRLLAELERRGLLANTVVIFTSDHGEQFGEHRLFEHGNSLYQPLVHVPLVLAGPRIPRGVRVKRPVSLRDIPRTVVEFTGGTEPNPFPGSSLRAAWEGTGEAEPLFTSMTLVGGKRLTAVREDSLYLIRRDEKRELYNLKSDPREEVNLAGVAEWRPALASLDGMLDSLLQHAGQP
jgi:arylsulfatase A-like enzyme